MLQQMSPLQRLSLLSKKSSRAGIGEA